MNIIQRIFGRKRKMADTGGLSPVQTWLAGDYPDDFVIEGGSESALRIATVMACVKVLTETIASLPAKLYDIGEDGTGEEVPTDPLLDLLSYTPNRYQTAYEFWEMLVAHLALRGNAVCKIVRTGGVATELVPVNPSRVRLEDFGGTLVYRIGEPDGSTTSLLQDDVFHIKGLSPDGYWGLSPISYANTTMKMASIVEKYSLSVFTMGGAKRVVLKHPATLSPKLRENLRTSWEQITKNSAKTAILEEGMDATILGMTAQDAQHIDTRKYNRTEICAIFRIPPHMVADLERSTFSNIDSQDLFFAKHTIRPWLKRIEGAIWRSFLAPDQARQVKFNLDAILRGDIKARTEACQIQFMHGALTMNEWRRFEDRSPTTEKQGDWHYVPANLSAIEDPTPKPAPAVPGAPPVGTPQKPTANDDPRPKDMAPLIEDAARRAGNYLCREGSRRAGPEFRQDAILYIESVLQPLFKSAGQPYYDLSSRLFDAFKSERDAGECRQAMVLWLRGELCSDPMEQVQLRLEAAAKVVAAQTRAAALTS